MAEIRITYPGGDPQTFTLPTEEHRSVTVGRNSACDYPVPIPSLSNLHCSIEKVGSDYYLTDENSTNGVLADGQKVVQTTLRPGIPYLLGEAILIYIPDGGEYVPKAAFIEETVSDTQDTAPQTATDEETSDDEPSSPASSASPSTPPTDVETDDEEPVEPSVPLPPKKKKVKTKAKSKKTGGFFADWSTGQTVYVVILTLLAFYAGLTLHHAIQTGEFLPARHLGIGK